MCISTERETRLGRDNSSHARKQARLPPRGGRPGSESGRDRLEGLSGLGGVNRLANPLEEESNWGAKKAMPATHSTSASTTRIRPAMAKLRLVARLLVMVHTMNMIRLTTGILARIRVPSQLRTEISRF